MSTSLALRTLAALACASLLSACNNPNGGYYDANGNFIATDTPYNMSEGKHPPLPGGTDDDRYYHHRRTTTVYYDRPGYYDYRGYYFDRSNDFGVPESMLPPRGMCRVWFADRPPEGQPGIESCNGIHARVPAGAYVIYGG